MKKTTGEKKVAVLESEEGGEACCQAVSIEGGVKIMIFQKSHRGEMKKDIG